MTSDSTTGLSIELHGNDSPVLAAALLEYVRAADAETVSVSLDVDTDGEIDLDPAALGRFLYTSTAGADQQAAVEARNSNGRRGNDSLGLVEGGSPDPEPATDPPEPVVGPSDAGEESGPSAAGSASEHDDAEGGASDGGEDDAAAEEASAAAAEDDAETEGYTCDDCGETFDTYQELGGHATHAHPDGDEAADDAVVTDESAEESADEEVEAGDYDETLDDMEGAEADAKIDEASGEATDEGDETADDGGDDEGASSTHHADPDDVQDDPTTTRDYVRELSPGTVPYHVSLVLAATPDEEPHTSGGVERLLDQTTWDTPAATSISNELRYLTEHGALERDRTDRSSPYEYERTSAGTHAFGLLEKHARQESELETFEDVIEDAAPPEDGDGEETADGQGEDEPAPSDDGATGPAVDSERDEWTEAEGHAVAGGEVTPKPGGDAAAAEADSAADSASEEEGSDDEDADGDSGISALFGEDTDDSADDFEIYDDGPSDDVEADD